MEVGVAEKIDDLIVDFPVWPKGNKFYQNKDFGSFYKSMVLLHYKVI